MKTEALLDPRFQPATNTKAVAGRWRNMPEAVKSFMLFRNFVTINIGLDRQLFHPHALKDLLECDNGLMIANVKSGGLALASGDAGISSKAGDIILVSLSSNTSLSGENCTLEALLVGDAMGVDIESHPAHQKAVVLPHTLPTTKLAHENISTFRKFAHLMRQLEADTMMKPLLETLKALASAQSAPTGNTDTQLLAKIRSFVESHLFDPDLSADLIAKELGLSRASLYRLAEPIGGIQKHIRSERLKRAYHCLSSDKAKATSITNLAYDLGFNSESAFRRSFKKNFGITPIEARQQP